MGLREELLSCVERLPDLSEDRLCEFEEYLDLNESFHFRNGDREEIWRNRRPAVAARCMNCGHQWVALFLPMPVMMAAQVQARSAFCVRCMEAERVALFRIVEKKAPVVDTFPSKPATLPATVIPTFKSRRDHAALAAERRDPVLPIKRSA